MKKSELQQIIKEEISKALNENTYISFKKDFDDKITFANAYLDNNIITIYLDNEPNKEKNIINSIVRTKYADSLKKIPSEADVIKFKIIKEEIQNVLNENKQFKDLTVGDTFLRFGENGQMWKKINSKQAEFVKNVGKKTAPYDKKPGALNVFPPTMDVTSANKSLSEIDPVQQGFDAAMKRAGVEPYSGPKSNSMKEKTYTVAFDYRYRDDLDFDSIDVTARSEEEAIEKAIEEISSKHIAAIWKSFHVVEVN